MSKAILPKNDPYIKLANTLNTVPNGFPSVEDGSHLKVLKYIFEPEEAELASKLKLTGETKEKLAKRIKIPLNQLEVKLEIMHKKGQLRKFKDKKGLIRYGLFPFVPGIYEDQIKRLDKRLVELIEDYIVKSGGDIVFTANPPIFRVLPINKAIKTELVIHPYAQAESIIKNASSWGIRDCTCRTAQALLGKGCNYPKSVCIELSDISGDFEYSNITKPITMEQALVYLEEAQNAGLIHTSMNVGSEHPYICNCCTCCCNVFRAMLKFGKPNAFVKSDYLINIDEKLCSGCGRCVDRCQFKVLSIENGICVANDNCVGCGTCSLICPEGALSLKPKPIKDRIKPPKNLVSWFLKRAWNRKKNPMKLI
ncbi:MAG: 4Fe-4S binding protein [Candidatus Heimdallarchaeota archaeon]|nr:4Fe-4S binding protein [Candidatus Heimdallarchaeota archaeon]